MGETLPPGEIHDIFTHWAQGQGVEINGVAPARFPGRGLGIAATRKIQAGEKLVKVSFAALLTVDSVPARFRDLHNGITVHGLLASFLAFGDSEDLDPFGPWIATWPLPGDFEETMPIMWSSTTSNAVKFGSNDKGCDSLGHDFCPLPPDISGQWNTSNQHNVAPMANNGLLAEQKTRFEKDWTKVSCVIPDADRERYMYYWLLINTRTFYHQRPGKKKEKTAREDRMALCPFADYFNHASADESCDVSSRNGSYTITSRKTYEPGEEVYVSYGNHSNDFLLTEYGFILSQNKSDALSLDALLLPLLPSHHRAILDEAGYLGNYTLTHHGLCHRTQVAIRTQTLSAEHWRLYVAGRDAELPCDVRAREEREADAWVWRFVLAVGLREAERVVGRFGGTSGTEEGGASRIDEEEDDRGVRAREVVVRRWVKIRDMLQSIRGRLNLGEEIVGGG